MPWWILENTLLAALLALLVALVSRSKRVPPVVRHGMWLVVLIKLIVPPVFSLGISVPGNWAVEKGAGQDVLKNFKIASRNVSADPPADLRPPLAGSDAMDAFPENELAISSSGSLELFETSDALSSPGWPGLERSEAPAGEESWRHASRVNSFAISAEVPEDAGISSADRASSPPGLPDAPRQGGPSHPPPALSISPANLLFWGALAGTLVVTLVQLARLVRLRRMLKRAVPAPEDFTALVVDLSAQLGVRPPVVRLSADIASPLVCALGPATLLWPASRLASLRESARQAVIVHELAHLARRDHWIGWVELAASCAWWWNPLYWYVRHQLHENAELACDAWVTGLFPEVRRAYARALVDLAELDSLATATVPALGVGDGSRKLFERRLVMIMGERVRYRMGALGFIGMGLLALAALPGCSPGMAADEPVPTDAPRAENFGVTAPEVGLSDSNLADPFADTAPSLEPNLPATETAPAVARPALAGDELSPSVDPNAESPRIDLSGGGATRAQDPAATSNDDRLKRLEDRFEALLTELRGMKSSGRAQGRQGLPMQPGQNPMSSKMPKKPAQSGTGRPGNTVIAGPEVSDLRGPSDEAVESLTRSTYKLPGRADEIAEFLKENLTDEIEVRVKDDLLIVTASAGDQTAIASFIRLLQTRGAAAKQPKAREQLREDELGAPKVTDGDEGGDFRVPDRSNRRVKPGRPREF